MKKNILLIASFCLVLASFGQPHTNAKSSVSKLIFCPELASKNLLFEMAVHSNNAAPTYSITPEVYSIDAAGRRSILPSTVEWRKEQDWEILSLAVKANENTNFISIEALIRNPGEFYFDDLNLYAQEMKGKWKQLSLINSSFEESDLQLTGYSASQEINVNISTAVAKVGVQSLRIVF